MNDHSTKVQNLARIRDNQRRSRARRKEYLQELEAKLRNCEQMGVEASAEIQSAARKVLEENRKLRALLLERGVPEADIAAVMGTNDRSLEQASAASNLVTMLNRKRTCGPSCTTSCGAQPSSTTLAPQSPAVAPISIPQRTAALSSNGGQSPLSVTSSAVSTPPGYNSLPFFPPPITSAPDPKADAMSHFSYQFDQPLQGSWTFPNEAIYVEPLPYDNTSSCLYAANIIRSMRTDVGPELEADLGCRVLGQECYVDNPTVFSAVEKYSNPGCDM
ncbi:uncharacterized protein BDR25DRAFT_291654 [Lindgomyces ingoldianus]|uniref:Uncharacterized protein n=1 Tax=Lindgomyces ingoldianus TaxID=673940 RepID=A0ACB6QM73_9PLEO|nr:uncharacterized protein BDR25DRAFT_291654 [Lindgomyces ingoldianus]KAF2467678.1 hypothetical protein BDR25DRAFT_291654 [Lindgomyces ingoldianus]